MANYRTRPRNIGCPEWNSTAVKEKRGTMGQTPHQVKKPKKVEVNLTLILEVKRKNNHQLINHKMERTFAHRRREVIEDMPFIAEFTGGQLCFLRTSLLQVNAEFTRITTVPLLSTFMAQLDHYSSQLMKIFKKGRGSRAQNQPNHGSHGREVRQECIPEALCIYLNEDPDSLVKKIMDVDAGAEGEMNKVVLGIHAVQREGAEATDPPADVGIIVEGCTVLQDLRDVANACATVFGLCCLNLSYPKDLRYTFEFLQKVVMGLDGDKLSTKVQVQTLH